MDALTFQLAFSEELLCVLNKPEVNIIVSDIKSIFKQQIFFLKSKCVFNTCQPL